MLDDPLLPRLNLSIEQNESPKYILYIKAYFVFIYKYYLKRSNLKFLLVQFIIIMYNIIVNLCIVPKVLRFKGNKISQLVLQFNDMFYILTRKNIVKVVKTCMHIFFEA